MSAATTTDGLEPPGASAQYNQKRSALRGEIVDDTALAMNVGFTTMLKAGPEVSFHKSPTEPPVADVLCASLPWRFVFLTRPLCVRPPLPISCRKWQSTARLRNAIEAADATPSGCLALRVHDTASAAENAAGAGRVAAATRGCDQDRATCRGSWETRRIAKDLSWVAGREGFAREAMANIIIERLPVLATRMSRR